MNEESEVKKYFLKEFELFDGEDYVTFNIVDINFDKKTINLAISHQGKISVCEFDLIKDDDNNLFFTYGPERQKINIKDFED